MRPTVQMPSKRPQLTPQRDPAAPFCILDKLASFRRPINVKEMADVFGIGEDSIYRMVNEGKMPTLILPGIAKKLFDPASVSFWIQQHNTIFRKFWKAS